MKRVEYVFFKIKGRETKGQLIDKILILNASRSVFIKNQIIYINIVCVLNIFRLCSLAGSLKSQNWLRKGVNMVERTARMLEEGTHHDVPNEKKTTYKTI